MSHFWEPTVNSAFLPLTASAPTTSGHFAKQSKLQEIHVSFKGVLPQFKTCQVLYMC